MVIICLLLLTLACLQQNCQCTFDVFIAQLIDLCMHLKKITQKKIVSLQDKLEIKKDKKGLVYVQGAALKEASNAKELNALFEEGSKNRHTASTSMFKMINFCNRLFIASLN